jgi:hypothetical protein
MALRDNYGAGEIWTVPSSGFLHVVFTYERERMCGAKSAVAFGNDIYIYIYIFESIYRYIHGNDRMAFVVVMMIVLSIIITI